MLELDDVGGKVPGIDDGLGNVLDGTGALDLSLERIGVGRVDILKTLKLTEKGS